MKLLVVTAFNPFPPCVGGAIMVHNTIKELSKKHSIYLICRATAAELGDLAGCVEQVEFVDPDRQSFFMVLFRCLVNLLFAIPLSITKCGSRTMRTKVIELIESNKFDALLLYDVGAIQYCPPISYKKVLVNVEDPPSLRRSRMNKLPVLSFKKRVVWLIDAGLMARYEKEFFPKMAKILLLSQADKQDMQEQGGYANVGYVSYGIDKRPLEEIFNCQKRMDGMIVFSGNMFHFPNVDGALFFLQHIFPLVLRLYPAAVLWIIGAEPDRLIHKAAVSFGKHVVITGRVENMSEYLQCAKVGICPVRLKIGVQTKILEALTWGTPVVTTSAGNSGIGGRSGHELWVEDNPEIFAQRVVSLLQGENWDHFSREGRKLVEERFSWERSAMELEKHIMSIQS